MRSILSVCSLVSRTSGMAGTRLQSILLVLCFIFHYSEATTASFDGHNYVEYTIENTAGETRKDKVTLGFKTTEAYGVLLYSCGGQGDFLLLELRRGKLVYTGDFGSTIEQSGAHQIILEHQYNDDAWHSVVLLRENGTHVRLSVDDETRTHNSQLDFQQLNLDKSLYIGGFGERQRNDKSCHDNHGKKNFVGCLQNVRFNSIDLLYGAYEKFTQYKTHGSMIFSCPSNAYNIISFHKETSLLNVKRDILIKNELNYEIEFRTFEPQGHVSTHICTNGAIDLDLVQGKLRLTLSFLGLAARDAIEIEADKKVDDGDWHKVSVIVKRQQGTIQLSVDGKQQLYKFKSHFKLEDELGLFMSTIRFGGNTPILPGLVTCYRKLSIDNKDITLSSPDIKERRHISDTCRIRDLCFPNPCQHGGVCRQSRGKFTCDCADTEYSGQLCQACIYKRTCEDIHKSGETRSGHYKICPNNERIFRVFCDMKTYGKPVTVLKHNMLNDTRVGDGRLIGSAPFAFYTHSIMYSVPKVSLLDLLAVSVECRQYIRFDCYRSRLLFDVGRYRHVHFKGARWLSRDSVIQHYWGGATPESRKCGCGMDRSCAKTATGQNKDCNCDVGDSKWRFDAGFLTDKETLPVTQVQFSKGRETNEDSFFTVGFLECFGTIPQTTVAPPLTTTTADMPTEVQPTLINGSMFSNNSWYRNRSIHNSQQSNATLLVAEISVADGTIGALFAKPWLITIVVVGTILCLLLVFLVFVLFRNQIADVFVKCIYGSHSQKPRIEIEEYNRYSTASEENSDWDIYRLSTAFPTSTPEPSYSPSDEDNLRVRTLEDLRNKRHFKRLSGWGSRTASAPTVVGSLKQSKRSIADSNKNDRIMINGTVTPGDSAISSHKYQTSSDAKQNSHNSSLQTLQSFETDPERSTTSTDGENDHDSLCTSEASRHTLERQSDAEKSKSSEKTVGNSSAQTDPPTVHNARLSDVSSSSSDFAPMETSSPRNSMIRVNGVSLTDSQPTYTEPVKAYYLPLNGYMYRQPMRRTNPLSPVDYPNQPQPAPRCNKAAGRLLPRRPSITSDIIQYYKHPTIDEGAEEFLEDDPEVDFRNTRNSDKSKFDRYGCHYDNQNYDADSPSSETRLLFDDALSREECEREADEQIALLKRKVIEKATSQDDST